MVEKGVTAEDLADQFRAISVAEFMEKNRHLLGYENTTKALITIVKELVDNALDASEESRILPDIKVVIKEINQDRFKVVVDDTGPGIVPDKVTSAFGKLLYGSKFHRLKMSRGQQGLGASGAILYSQLTTGKPAKIVSGTGKDIHIFELMIDVTKNEPKIISHKTEKNEKKWTGIKVELETEGRYLEGKQSILEYLKQTAIANPFAKIVFDGPNGKVTFDRAVKELPPQPKEIKPHPYGVEIGLLRRMLENTKSRNLTGFLTTEFSRVGRSSAEQICKLAKLDAGKKPQQLAHEETERLHKTMQVVKLVAPPTDCLSPLGEKLITEGLKKEIEAEYFVAVSRSPAVYRGYPFQVEVGMAYGGKLPPDQTMQLMRFANKVPLLYHQSDCATTEGVVDTDFRRYGFSQPAGQLPAGPLIIFIHFASVWVPYTSEGKQAIANYPDIVKEIKLALQEAGRRLAIYVRQKAKQKERQMRRQIFERYMTAIADALSKLTGKDNKTILNKLENITKKYAKVMEDEGSKEEAGKSG